MPVAGPARKKVSGVKGKRPAMELACVRGIVANPLPVKEKKKVGGVKVSRAAMVPGSTGDRERISLGGGRANPVPSGCPEKKKVGGVTAQARTGSTSAHPQSCPQNCQGEIIEGTWVHSRTCPWSSVLWKSHGATAADWRCPFHCPPVEMGLCWTHQQDCKFWDRMGRTPFDHRPQDMKSMQARARAVEQSEAERQRAIVLQDFPGALDDNDDDLPF